jgi:hypothetical protein
VRLGLVLTLACAGKP